jgi:hypothetical protein
MGRSDLKAGAANLRSQCEFAKNPTYVRDFAFETSGCDILDWRIHKLIRGPQCYSVQIPPVVFIKSPVSNSSLFNNTL